MIKGPCLLAVLVSQAVALLVSVTQVNYSTLVWNALYLRAVFVHGQLTIIFIVSVCLSVCLFVCAEFFSAVFDPISIKLGHMFYVWV